MKQNKEELNETENKLNQMNLIRTGESHENEMN